MSNQQDIARLANEARKRIQELGPDECMERVADGAVLIDVREEKEFRAGSIRGAVHISRGNLPSGIDALAPDKSQAIVCFCAIGHRSALAADALQQLGYTHVASMAGGLKAFLTNTRQRKIA